MSEVEDLSTDFTQKISLTLGLHVSQELQTSKIRKQELTADSKEDTRIRTEKWKPMPYSHRERIKNKMSQE